MERLKEMHLTTLEERRESGDLITIYKLMKNIEETENFNIKKKKERLDI